MSAASTVGANSPSREQLGQAHLLCLRIEFRRDRREAVFLFVQCMSPLKVLNLARSSCAT